ncbi:hypothetical protein [Chryseobacterium sp. ERMR1:04]|uniref:hypothetical protein n=1 Tax=Chryseobacterium sp. ERMR1:04 TaxID=1705393 RepID=UPI0006C894AD|nr:hypothetical protein [Chryseobacterium sp. ERMR1:04]KPH14772.1 hypothetical protein AMQ68_04820 [Chryseobacterium sp. ERMR1:04]
MKLKTIIPICFVFFSTTYAQNKNREIDSIKNLIEKNYVQGDRNAYASLRNVTNLYYISREAGFYSGQIYSIFEESRINYLNGYIDAALLKINEGIDLATSRKDYNMMCRFLLLYQLALLRMNNPQSSQLIINKAEEYNKFVNSREDQEINTIYILLAKADLLHTNDDLNIRKQIIAQKKLAYSNILRINESNRLKKFTLIYVLQSISLSLASFSDIDASRKYLRIADHLLISFHDESFITQSLIIKGIIANNTNNYKEAIAYLHDAALKANKINNTYRLSEIYALLNTSYEHLNDFENAETYSKKYKFYEDSLDILKTKIADINLISSINNKVLNHEKKKNNNNIIIIISFFLAVIVMCYFYYRFYLNKKNVKEINEKEISKTNDYSNQSIELESTSKLVNLAKVDVNTFYVEFQKVYPKVYKELKESYPEMNISDLNFCSLLKMNFKIKEISQYTNSSIRAAEARRFRITKKMNLKNQDELYIVLSTIN